MSEEKKMITLEQYRGIDLSIFFLLVCGLELLNIFVFRNYFPNQVFCISLVLPLSLLVMQRWNGWAVLIAAAGGAAFCFANGTASPASYLVYIFGNCFVILNMLWYPITGKSRISERFGLKILFALTGYFFISFGRALVATAFEGNIFENLLSFLSADGLNAAIGLVVLLIAGKQPGLFEDQKTYIRRMRDEKQKEKERQSEKHEELFYEEPDDTTE